MKDKQKPIKKNCYNCLHLNYFEKESYESSDSSGFYCDKDYKTEKQEKDHLEKLQIAKYLEKAKKCCEL